MIRQALFRDTEILREIYNDAILNTTANFETEPKSREEMEEWFDSHEAPYTVFVDEEDGRIRGYVALSPFKNRKGVVSVYINREDRGKGVGRKLLEELISYAREREDLSMLVAYVTSENSVSMRLHESVGFVRSGLISRAGTKFGRDLDLQLYRMSVNK